MSKQFYTYLTPSDYQILEKVLCSKFSAWFYQETTKGAFRRLPSLAIVKMGKEKLSAYICSQNSEGKQGSIKENSIECSRSYVGQSEFQRGRFFFQTNLLDETGDLKKKSDEFLSWASSVFRFLKSHLIYEKQIDCYFGEEAHRLYQKDQAIFKDNV